MPLIGVAGKIVDPSDGNVQWKIPYKKIMCRMNQEQYFQSPSFNFVESSWRIRFYPNGDKIDEDEKFFTVYLCVEHLRQPIVTLNVCLNLSLDNIEEDQIEHKMIIGSHTFSNDYQTYVWEKILRSNLVWNREQCSSPITISCFATTKDSLPMFTFYRSMCRKTQLSEDLKKMYDDKQDTDVTFSVGGRSFEAHKLILATRSPKFDELLKDHENDDPFTFNSCDPDAFETLLQFLYTGTVEKLPLEKVINLYRAADYFCEDLAGICARYMVELISEDTRDKICELAIEYGDKWMESAACMFHDTNMAMDDADG